MPPPPWFSARLVSVSTLAPSVRELTFARNLGARAVSASLCPRSVNDVNSPQYGYGPAFDSLLKRIAQTIR